MELYCPRWLPPLDGHDEYTLHVTAHQTPPSLSSPSFPAGYMLIEAKIGVILFADLSPVHALKGLDLTKYLAIHPLSIATSNLISDLQIPFPLDTSIQWKTQTLAGARSASSRLESEAELEAALKEFLCSSVIDLCSAVTLRVEKFVRVDKTEFAEWVRWYNHNSAAWEGFNRDYWKAISRPRSWCDPWFRKLPTMTMREALDKEDWDDDIDDWVEDDVDLTEIKQEKEEEMVVVVECPLCRHTKV